MIIFLRRLSKNTHYTEIVSFIEPAIKGGLFRKAGQIDSVQMLIIRDRNTDTVEYHGLVRISPNEAAERAVKKLNNTVFQGKTIEVRYYFPRSWKNDRRQYTLAPNFVLVCQRKKSRRRHSLESKIVNPDLMGRFNHYSF